MILGLLLEEFLPLVVFAVVTWVYGLKPGVIAAIICSVGRCTYLTLTSGHVPIYIVSSEALVIGIGAIALWANKSYLFKFQPVVTHLIFAVVLAYFQIFDRPLMLGVLDDMHNQLDEATRQVFHQPAMREMASRLSLDSIFVCLAHAAITAYCAMRTSERIWLLVRVVGPWFWSIAIVFFELGRTRLGWT